MRMNIYPEKLLEAKDVLGSFAKLGAVCGVSGNAIMKWYASGKPPRTEYTGETDYAGKIMTAVGQRIEISRDMLIPAIQRSTEAK